MAFVCSELSYQSIDTREIGDEATWTLSSAKPGNGAACLRDGNDDSFWQSDGPQPHLVNIHFNKKMCVKEVSFYIDYKLDESYTPSKIAIRIGNTPNDLKDYEVIELFEPSGWVVIPLNKVNKEMKINLLQIAILQSHQSGRDTHLRQVKVFGFRENDTEIFNIPLSFFTSNEFQQFSCIR